jgi:hypothetical protein
MTDGATRVRARKSDRKKVEPMPAEHVRVPLAVRYTRAQTERISNGLLPRDMDDKWFIYREGDEIFFHRSWTGMCVFVARIEEDIDGSTLVEAAVRHDPKARSPHDAARDVGVLLEIIDHLLLRDRDDDDPGSLSPA